MKPITYAALHHPAADAMVGVLEGLGYQLTRIQPDAQAHLRVASIQPDLVVVDLGGVPASAHDLVSSVRTHTDLPVLLVRHPDTPFALVAACLSSGADDVLSADADFLEVNSRLAVLGRIARDRRRATQQAFAYEVQITDLKRLSILDGLTGMYNRRHLFHLLRQELKRARRHVLDLSVVMVDIDHFKRVNDTHGHEVGDEALKHVSDVLTSTVREEDVVGRYGGEEFCIVLPQTCLEAGIHLAERIRHQIECSPLLLPGAQLLMTISSGVSAYLPGDRIDVNDLVRRADEALYRAKDEGRNRVSYDGKLPTAPPSRIATPEAAG